MLRTAILAALALGVTHASAAMNPEETAYWVGACDALYSAGLHHRVTIRVEPKGNGPEFMLCQGDGKGMNYLTVRPEQ